MVDWKVVNYFAGLINRFDLVVERFSSHGFGAAKHVTDVLRSTVSAHARDDGYADYFWT